MSLWPPKAPWVPSSRGNMPLAPPANPICGHRRPQGARARPSVIGRHSGSRNAERIGYKQQKRDKTPVARARSQIVIPPGGPGQTVQIVVCGSASSPPPPIQWGTRGAAAGPVPLCLCSASSVCRESLTQPTKVDRTGGEWKCPCLRWNATGLGGSDPLHEQQQGPVPELVHGSFFFARQLFFFFVFLFGPTGPADRHRPWRSISLSSCGGKTLVGDRLIPETASGALESGHRKPVGNLRPISRCRFFSAPGSKCSNPCPAPNPDLEEDWWTCA